MSTEQPDSISVVPESSPYFEVLDWGIADAFDDYLTEKCTLEFFSKTIEREGVPFVRQFFPKEKSSALGLGILLEAFWKDQAEQPKP